MKRFLFVLLAGLASCDCHSPCPPPRDMAPPVDAIAPVDMCIACNAVINPCPALGLECNPASGCCVAASDKVDLSASCLSPGADCSKSPVPPCCDGIACGQSGRCFIYGDM